MSVFTRAATCAVVLLAVAPVAAAAERPSPAGWVDDRVDTLAETLGEAAQTSPQAFGEVTFAQVDRLTDLETAGARLFGALWEEASEHQRQRFVERYAILLARVYDTTIAERAPKLEHDVLGARRVGEELVEVGAEATVPDQGTMRVRYELIPCQEHDWAIINVVVDGVDLLHLVRESLRSTYPDGAPSSLRSINRWLARRSDS